MPWGWLRRLEQRGALSAVSIFTELGDHLISLSKVVNERVEACHEDKEKEANNLLCLGSTSNSFDSWTGDLLAEMILRCRRSGVAAETVCNPHAALRQAGILHIHQAVTEKCKLCQFLGMT